MSNRQASQLGDVYYFGEFAFDGEQFELVKNNEPIQLRLQAARVLELLVRHAPNMVPREQLRETVWDNGVSVDFDQGLNSCINQLRLVLNDSAAEPIFIETMTKRGYRFIADVTRKSKRNFERSVALATTTSLILIFAIIWIFQGNQEVEVSPPPRVYISPIVVGDDLADRLDPVALTAIRLSVVNRLMQANSDAIHVINGESLWLDVAKTGSEFADFVVKITLAENDKGLQLRASINKMGGQTSVSRTVIDIAGIEINTVSIAAGNLASWIGKDFNIALPASPDAGLDRSPLYVDALNHAMRSMRLADRESLRSAVKWFDKALKVHPFSAEASGAKAVVLSMLAGSPGFDFPDTYDSVLGLAMDIRGSSGPTKYSEIARGNVFLYRDWNVERAKRSFDLAAEIAPGDALVHSMRAGMFAALGNADAAADSAERAMRLDPLSMAVQGDRCVHLVAAHRSESAVAACSWVLELDPSDDWSRITLAVALNQLGDFDAARDALLPIAQSFDRAARAGPDGSLNEDSLNPSWASYQEMNCYLAEQLKEAASQGTLSKFLLAGFFSECGNYEKVAELLSEAKLAHETGILFYRVDPRLEAFRQEPIASSINMRITPRA